MEVILPSPAADFDINSARSSPHVTAPSTPKLSGEYYFSAPTSPSHLSQFYKDFDDFLVPSGSGGTVPKRSSPKKLIGDDFAFDVSEEWETASQLSAEELFDGGVIKTLKPPPVGMQLPKVAAKKILQGAFSPRGKNRKERTDLSAVATDEVSHRGRPVNASKSSSRRAARSLSPIRDGEYQYWEDDKQQSDNAKNSSLLCSSKSSKKWRLKDFFLFRSASEGRAAEKDHLKKYTSAYRHSSFRATDSPGPKKGPVSAHELHYTVNRAVSQDLKKKTFLPYKQGILGRLAFNPAVHALANGFGFSRK